MSARSGRVLGSQIVQPSVLAVALITAEDGWTLDHLPREIDSTGDSLRRAGGVRGSPTKRTVIQLGESDKSQTEEESS